MLPNRYDCEGGCIIHVVRLVVKGAASSVYGEASSRNTKRQPSDLYAGASEQNSRNARRQMHAATAPRLFLRLGFRWTIQNKTTRP
jgi:hypothetical protein